MKTLGTCAMQNYPTKRDKSEFVHMYRLGFEQLRKQVEKLKANRLYSPVASGYWRNYEKLKMAQWLGERARWFFGYSPSYNNADIAWNYLKFYEKMIQNGREEE